MTRLRVAAGVLNQTPLDWTGNRQNILEAIAAAKKEKASLLCLPELCITGYGCEDAFYSAGMQEMALTVLQEIAPATAGMVVSMGLPIFHQRALFNCAALLADGGILGFVAKRFLCGDGLHYEPRWFKPWPRDVRDMITINGQEYPIGDVVFDCGGVKIGFEICEDAWVATRPGRQMSSDAVDIILNPSASHFAFGKIDVRKRLVLEGSRAFSVTYIYSNLLGNEAGRVIYDGGAMIASIGKLLAAGPRFSFAPWQVTTAVVDMQAARETASRYVSNQPELGKSDDSLVRADFHWPDIEPEARAVGGSPFDAGSFVKEEEFTRAEALGLFDYLRKSRSSGFIVSLSGGADSSAVSCLVAIMAEMAWQELGAEVFLQRLGHIKALKDCASQQERVERLLHCVYQATRNSGDVTRNAASSLAAALRATFSLWEIDELVTSYVSQVESALGRQLTWETDDISLQNIQARVRAPGIWLLANVKNSLLLSTSNRSEAAVGYATMDGDTCGGLSPIAGIDKAFLLHWLRWLEKTGPEGLHPVPALSVVTGLLPTAELRPPGEHQTDEQDLMPYPVLDAIERLAIRDKLAPREVFRELRPHFQQYSLSDLHHWVERFFRLWCRNQWKRERYAPSFHLDDENLDPKTWCRFPILSGGFTRELDELRQYVAGLEQQEPG